MANLTEKQLRERIASVIGDTLVDAKILKRNPYTQATDAWIGAFTHKFDYGLGAGPETVVHAWFIRRYRVEAGIMQKEDMQHFQLNGFMKHSFGTDTVNTEDVFQDNIDKLAEAFKADDVWNNFSGFTGDVNSISLIFEPIGLIKIDATATIHSVNGRLAVQILNC